MSGQAEIAKPFITEKIVKTSVFKLFKKGEPTLYNIPPLFLATRDNDLSLIGYMIERGADVNQLAFDSNGIGRSCLGLASELEKVDEVQLLLKHGARVNQSPTLGKPCLNGNIELVKVLLEAGANPNQAWLNGETPLYLARKNHHVDVERILLEYGAEHRLTELFEKDLKRREPEKEREGFDVEEKFDEFDGTDANENQVKTKERKEEKEKKESVEKEEKTCLDLTRPVTLSVTSMTRELHEV